MTSELRHVNALVIEDRDDDFELLLRELKKGGFELRIERIQTPEDLEEQLKNLESWDIVISDYHLPRLTGIEALKLVRERNQEVPFILVSGTVGEEFAVAAMKNGANDYLLKDSLIRLVPAIEREIREAMVRRELKASVQQSEEQVRRSQKMEAVGRLAGGIAHDFNNLLGAVMLCTESILENSDRDLVKRSAETIHKAATRGAELVRKLMIFSKSQRSHARAVSINNTIQDAMTLIERLVTEGTEIRKELDPKLGKIKIDPVHLEQVIFNLVSNAKDAMREGGVLTLRTRMKEAEVVLEVIDTGHGMDSATAQRIFEPFFTTKPEGQGTGLGLPTVYGIVQASGAHIEVQSAPGQGTTFRITFPHFDTAEPEPEANALRIDRGSESGRVILLVEDDDDLRRVVRTTLEQRGYLVLEADNGERALAMAAERIASLDLLITDLVMPGLNGVELSRRIRELRQDLPILLVTGYPKETDLASLEVENLPYLMKPFNAASFIQRVRETLK